jgi:hypothetical protein
MTDVRIFFSVTEIRLQVVLSQSVRNLTGKILGIETTHRATDWTTCCYDTRGLNLRDSCHWRVSLLLSAHLASLSESERIPLQADLESCKSTSQPSIDRLIAEMSTRHSNILGHDLGPEFTWRLSWLVAFRDKMTSKLLSTIKHDPKRASAKNWPLKSPAQAPPPK